MKFNTSLIHVNIGRSDLPSILDMFKIDISERNKMETFSQALFGTKEYKFDDVPLPYSLVVATLLYLRYYPPLSFVQWLIAIKVADETSNGFRNFDWDTLLDHALASCIRMTETKVSATLYKYLLG